ncbi:Uncharacterised protein [Bordetella pertussis]|nr:Uncharacterised protein [Bordetella pertussis]
MARSIHHWASTLSNSPAAARSCRKSQAARKRGCSSMR